MRILPFIVILSLFMACKDDAATTNTRTKKAIDGPLFTKLSPRQTGVQFSNTLKEDPNTLYNVLAYDYFYNGAGVAIGDLNNDGLSDLVFTANQSADKIYLNKGKLKFQDISAQSKLDEFIGWSAGVTLADVNNDGWLDIYICRGGPESDYAKRRNLLFINNKDLTFSEKAEEYGLADPKIGTQAVFFDYNKDGWLDCYVMNESIYAGLSINRVLEEMQDEQKLHFASGTLYRNLKGKFIDVSKKAGILRQGYGLGLAVSDFNNDTWPDLYVANDYSSPDILWINQKDGTFKDEIKTKTDHTSWFSMGVDVADINNDGHLDIGVVDMSTQDHIMGKTLMASMNSNLFYLIKGLGYQRQHMFNALQLNNGDGTYSNIAGAAKMTSTEWSWSSLFADFDNDGDKDYYVTNGYKLCHRDNDFQMKLTNLKKKHNGTVPQQLRKLVHDEIPSYKTRNILYENKGFAQFEEAATAWGVDDLSFSSGAAYGDLDNDGDLDLVVNNTDEPAFVYENNSQSNYLRIKLINENISYGTRVKAYIGKEVQLIEYNPTRGYLSRVEDGIHFGLGTATKVDSIVVTWPNRKAQKLYNVKANQLLNITYDAQTRPDKVRKNTQQFFANTTQIPTFQHTENGFNDFLKEILLPYKQSTLGPFLSTADVDANGLDDVFVGGAKEQAGALFLQQQDGTWAKSSAAVFAKDKASEDMKSVFFDADQDGDLDLYVVSGGSEFAKNDPAFQDRLYINNGSGNFSKANNKLPNLLQAGMAVVASDYDQDGDQDLFVSGRVEAQRYPYSVRSTILKNNNGKFENIADQLPPELVNAGLINAAIWMDIDGDQDDDLIIAGEWTSVQIFKNEQGKLTAATGFSAEERGWWYSLKAVDIDKDGDQDIVAGNLGLNSKFSASAQKPFSIYADDFDGNGTCDVVLAKKYKGKIVPVRGRECSTQQMPFISQKFRTYDAFANADLAGILGEEKLNKSLQLSATTFESCVYINDGKGNFTKNKLPIQAQLFPTWGIETADFNEDGFEDLFLTGNLYGMEIETPRLDAGKGLILLNDTKGKFIPLSAEESGILVRGDLRDVVLLNNNKQVLISRNNESLVGYKLK